MELVVGERGAHFEGPWEFPSARAHNDEREIITYRKS
jgi:hypothetical protein